MQKITNAQELRELLTVHSDDISMNMKVTHDENDCTAVMSIFFESDDSKPLYESTLKVKRTVYQGDYMIFEPLEDTDEIQPLILSEVNCDNIGYCSFSDEQAERLRRGEKLDSYYYHFGFYHFPYELTGECDQCACAPSVMIEVKPH